MKLRPIVTPPEWQTAWEQMLVKEKELTRARDRLAAQRRRMPRMAVEKEYRFEGPRGPASLLDLFDGRRQLVVYRFFFEPGVCGWPERGCRGCVDEWHGTNAFLRDGDQVFRTSFVNGRGDEALGSTFSYLDITALGRQEQWEDSPEGYPQTETHPEWWRLPDAY